MVRDMNVTSIGSYVTEMRQLTSIQLTQFGNIWQLSLSGWCYVTDYNG